MHLHEKTFDPGLRPPDLTAMFFGPSAALCSLKERPHWLCALLIAAGWSVAVNFYVVGRIGFARLLSVAVQANATIDPQTVLQNALERKTMIFAVQGISTFLGTFVTALIVAKVLWLVATVIGVDLHFRRVLAVVAHVAMLVSVVRESMLALTVTAMRNLDNFDMRNPLATNLAFFFRPDSPVVFRLLASLDILTLANVFLLALGLSKVSDDLSLRKAGLLVAVPWGFYVVGSALLPSL